MSQNVRWVNEGAGQMSTATFLDCLFFFFSSTPLSMLYFLSLWSFPLSCSIPFFTTLIPVVTIGDLFCTFSFSLAGSLLSHHCLSILGSIVCSQCPYHSISFEWSPLFFFASSFHTNPIRMFSFTACLTLKCISYFSLPFVHNGGPLGPIQFQVFSRRNFGTKLAPYLYTPKATTNQQKEHSKNVAFQNGGQKTNFRFAKIVTWPKFEKPLSQWNFPMKFGSKYENMKTFTFLK